MTVFLDLLRNDDYIGTMEKKSLHIETIIEMLLMLTHEKKPGCLFSRDMTGLQQDLLLRRIVQVVKNRILIKGSTIEFKEKCVKIIM